MTAKARWVSVACCAFGLAAVVAIGILVLAGKGRPTPAAAVQATTAPVEPDQPPVFRDMTAATGVDCTYRNGEEAGHYALVETLGGGVALIDYDGDGLLDIFVTGGGYFDGPDKKEIKGYPSRLYRNLGNWRFQDVTHAVGLDRPLFYTHGCAVADYDKDGWPDLLVTGWGRLALYHNVADSTAPGGRRFVEATKQAGLDQDRLWSSSAAWGDLDGDGYPDLYVCHYLNWSFGNHPTCYSGDKRKLCSPRVFDALPHKLYRNNRDGTFRDVSQEAGIYQKAALQRSKGLGVIIVNLKDQGLPDIYVANDTSGNLLYMNRGGMRFEEVAMEVGAARDDKGMANGSMGLDAGDYDGSGRPSLWVTNYMHEYHALYRNDGDGRFTHWTTQSGIGAIGARYVAWGTGFIDLDNDGWEDLVIANGLETWQPGEPELQQRALLLRNQGKGKFIDVSDHGGRYFRTKHLGRGLALGDLDNDGRTDIVISHVNEPIVLLRNEAAEGNHWLGAELATPDHGDVVGARLALDVDGRTLTRFTKGGGSFLSAHDPRRLFGLGKTTQVGRLTVTWPSGEPRTQVWDNLAIDRYHRLVQGQPTPQKERRQ